MAWEWQVWRCFDEVRDAFEEKGWSYRLDGRDDNEVVPLLADAGDYCIVFFDRDPDTGECWFELRDETRNRVVFIQGTSNIPTPERAADLLADYGTSPSEEGEPGGLLYTPLYTPPIAPVAHAIEGG